MRPLGLSILLLTFLTACRPGLVPGASVSGSSLTVTYATGVPVLSGQVRLPAFTTKATSAQVADRAFVALIDGNGVTQAGGVTDAAGDFTLFPVANGFTPVVGDFYTLEAVKRPAAGAALTLRTTVQLQGFTWTSITGSTIVVNLTTTAIALIDAADAAVAPAATMGKVSGLNHDVAAAIGAWTPARITGRVTGLTAVLTDDGDPGGITSKTYTGGYTITNATDLANFKAYTAITGTLTVNAPGLTVIDLPLLTTITGNLDVSSQAALTTLNLPSLKAVTGTLTLNTNAALTTLGLAGLDSIGGLLTITDNTVLPTAAATALHSQIGSPGGSLISGNAP